MGIARSGNNNIDALLNNDRHWVSTGRAATLTYSLDSTGSDGFNYSQRQMVREAFRQWSKVANLTFREVSSGGNLRLKGQNGTAGSAQAHYDRDWWNPTSWGSEQLKYVDIKLGKGNSTGKGGRLLAQAIHEIGHALGLKHPGNYNGSDTGTGPFLSYQDDNSTNTVMSYNEVGAQEATPMAFDIRAVQYAYGVRAANTGNTNYRFSTVYGYNDGARFEGSSSTRLKMSIWDSAGTDTLDFSNLAADSTGYHFDARQGGILTKRSAFNSKSYTPVDNGSSTTRTYRTSDYGTTIAYGTNIENVTGSSSKDTIYGTDFNNTLKGGGGGDTIYAFGGRDFVYGGDGVDVVLGGEGNDFIYGEADRDILYGEAGNDYVSGGTGNDALYGGVGNDTLSGYIGNDSLYGQDGNDTLYGWTGQDYLSGGAGNDTMRGGTGNDRYLVDRSGDRVIEEANGGTDTVYSSVSRSLSDHVENLTLTEQAYYGIGNDARNKLTGNDVANYLYGRDGNDTLDGKGNDDILSGGAGNDYLLGGAGKDHLLGGSGDDQLIGGTGADIFSFGSLTTGGLDIITDFNRYTGDKISVSASSFGGGLTRGLLDAGKFVLGAIATDANDRILYNRSTGALSFDVDGVGGRSAVQFAKLSNYATLSHSDFKIA